MISFEPKYGVVPAMTQLRYFTLSLIWLRENFGESKNGSRWFFKTIENGPIVYYFENLEDALLFKLTWGGDI